MLENDFLGLKSGVLDQAGVVGSRAGHLAMIDCLNNRIDLFPYNGTGGVHLPVQCIVAFSGIRKALISTNDYNNRVVECQLAAQKLMEAGGLGGCKCEETAILGSVSRVTWERHGEELDEPLRKRARHFFSEVDRVEKGLKHFVEGDLSAFGELINER